MRQPLRRLILQTWTQTGGNSPQIRIAAPFQIWSRQNFTTTPPFSRTAGSDGGKIDQALEQAKEKQIRTPWHHEGSDTPPVRRERSAGAMTKGKLLTTPSRLLKLIVPLTTLDKNSDRKDIEPLALLVHPQQPLSYLERLIQSELPSIQDNNGQQKIPEVRFWAEDSGEDSLMPSKRRDKDDTEDEADMDHTKIDGQVEKTGKVGKKSGIRGGPGEGGVETYSGLGHEAPEKSHGDRRFIRWSPSTEIGDFIRDAARGQQFAVDIEGAVEPIMVGVPSFNDRTHYLRIRLRKLSTEIANMATVKKECDMAAHKGAQRVAMGGFGLLAGWWYVVYRLTFETELGWDTMEPITYLVGLITVMGGYLWFLWHNREVSYRSALNLTVSRRQNKLYQQKGFNLHKWETLADEANQLRKEIIQIAREYDVDWDETEDEVHEGVKEVLKEQRKSTKSDNDDSKEEKQDKETETSK